MKRALAVTALTIALATASLPAYAVPTRALPQHPSVAVAHSQGNGPEPSVGVIVKFKQPENAALGAKLLAGSSESSAAALDTRRGLYAFTSSHSASDAQYAAQLMLTAPGVEYAEPNYVRSLAAYTAPTDPDFTDSTTWVAYGSDYYPSGKHWWLSAIKAPDAWAIGQGTTYPVHGTAGSIKIAVIDTGIYLSHPDLNGGAIVAGRDECASYDPNTGIFTTDGDITPDVQADLAESSHGTAVAAAAGGEIDGVGMVGSGWNPTVVGYKVAGPITSAWDTYPAGSILMLDGAITQAMYDAVDAGCKVINMSLVGPAYSQAYTDAIAYAHSHGVVVVCAVGNEGDTTVNYPAACQYAVGVGATQLNGSASTPGRAFFSDYAPGVVDLAAPGETFWSADKPDWDSDGTGTVSTPGYQFWSGTSFASPAAAGALAYLWRAMPDLTNDQIVSYMESSAVDMGTAGRDDYYGYGLVNMQAAYNRLIADYPMLTTPSVSAPAFAGAHQATITWKAVAGYNVSYRVSVDGVLRATTASTSIVATNLADGAHTVSVLPTSARNWNTTTAAGTGSLIEDSVSPVVSGFAWDATKLTWAVSDTNTYTVQARIDAGAASTLASNSLVPGALTPGAHVVYVNATDGAGNTSGWVSYAFSVSPAAPVVPDVSVSDATTAAVSWAAVSGATSYDYQVNGGAVASTTATGFVVSGLVGGTTQVSVRAAAGTVTSAWTNATVTDNIVVPAVPSPSAPSAVALPAVTVTWPVAADAKSYEARLDGGSSVATTGLSASFDLPATGAHTVSVRAVNNLSQSQWATVTVTFSPAVAGPTVASVVVTDAVSATVSWPAVPGATSYEYQVGLQTIQSTTDTGFVVSGLVPGVTDVRVRAVAPGSESLWSLATITDNLVVPDLPALSVPATVAVPSVTATWPAAPNALSYEVRLDGGSSVATTALFAALPLTPGAHTVAVRSLDNLAASDWVTSTVTYEAPQLPVPAFSLSVSAGRIVYPARAVSLFAGCSAPGRTARLQSSTDGWNWTDVAAGSFATTVAPASVSLPVGVSRTTFFRIVFAGDSEYAPAVSPAVSVIYVPRLGTPSAPKRVARRHKFTVAETISAPAANTASSVTFRFQRWQKVHGRYQWVTRKTVRVSGKYKSATSVSYSARTSLYPSGKWRVIAAYAGSPLYGAATSGARAISVQ